MRKLISGMLIAATLLALSSTAVSGAVPVLRVRPAPEVAGQQTTDHAPARVGVDRAARGAAAGG